MNQSAAVDKASLIAECQKSCPKLLLQSRVAASHEAFDQEAGTVPLIVALEGIGGASRTYVEWSELEALVYREHVPHTLFRNPPVPLRLSNLDTFRSPNHTVGSSAQQSVVHEMVADPVNSRLLVLMDNGNLEVWDAFSYEMLSSQLFITPGETPRVAGQQFAGAAAADLGDLGPAADQDLPRDDQERMHHQAETKAREYAKRLLAMQPRQRIVRYDPTSSLIIANTTAGDRCLRFHESLALGCVFRTKLDWTGLSALPSHDHGIFDGHVGSRSDSSKGTVDDFVFIHQQGILVCTIVGTSVVLGFSVQTGQVVAKFTQHEPQYQAPSLLYVSGPQCLVTGGAGRGDNDLRVWDLGKELFPLLSKQGPTPAQNNDAVQKQCDRLFKLFEQGAVAFGPIPRWRMAVLTSVDHRANDSDGRATLIGTTYDDGTLEWHSSHTRLRSLEEAYENPTGPPDWGMPPPKLIKGDRVAVWQTLRHATLRRAFELMDVDRSGSVSRSEFSKTVQGHLSYGCSDKHVQTTLSQAEIDIVFNTLDVNHDGSVQFSELFQLLGQDLTLEKPNLPKDVPCKAVLRGHSRGITSLSYLPAAMLIVSASKDGTIRLWDPISRPCRLSHPARRAHIKQWPGYYEAIPEQWSNCNAPYSECIRLSLEPEGANVDSKDQVREASWRSVAQQVEVMQMKAGQGCCRVQLTVDGIQGACALDAVAKGQETMPAAIGFIYLMESGELIDIPVTQFDQRYVELLDATLFTVADITKDTSISKMRKVFNGRHRVARILYAVSNHLSSLAILRDKLAQNHASALPKQALLNFSAEFVPFYQSGDGPTRDISHRFIHGFVGNGYRHQSDGKTTVVCQATITRKMGHDFVQVVVDESSEILDVHMSQITFQAQSSTRTNSQHKFDVGSKVYVDRNLTEAFAPEKHSTAGDGAGFEVLCAVVASADGRQKRVMSWVVGRTCVQQRACDIHAPLPTKTLAACSRGFLAHWSMLLHLFRANLPSTKGMLEAERASSVEQCTILANILRKASLDQRHVQPGLAAEHLKEAFKIAISAPLRTRPVQQAVRYAITGAYCAVKHPREQTVCPAALLQELERQAREDAPSAVSRIIVVLLQSGLRKRLAKLAAVDTSVDVESGPKLNYGLLWEAVESIHSKILLPEEFFHLLCLLSRFDRHKSRVTDFWESFRKAYPTVTHDAEYFDLDLFSSYVQHIDPLCQLQTNLGIVHNTLRAHKGPSCASDHRRSNLRQYAKVCAHKRWHRALIAVGSSMTKLTHELRNQALGHVLSGIKEELDETLDARLLLAESRETEQQDIRHTESVAGFNVHDFALQPDRCSHGRTAYEGWGLVDEDDNSTGVPVTVLEISAARLEELQSHGRPYAFHLAREAQRHEMLQNIPHFIRMHSDAVMLAKEDFDVHPASSEEAGTRLCVERLEGWLPLRKVIETRGYLGSGHKLQVVRCWGKQLLHAIKSLHGPRNILMYHLSPDSIFVSPDGRHLKIVSLEHAGALAADGIIHGHLVEAPDLPAAFLTLENGYVPPEAVQIASAHASNAKKTAEATVPNPSISSLKAPTRAWDIWLFGALIYELVFGVQPPSYAAQLNTFLETQRAGDSVRCAEEQNAVTTRRSLFYNFFEAMGRSAFHGSTIGSRQVVVDDSEGPHGELMIQGCSSKTPNVVGSAPTALLDALGGRSLSTLLPQLIVPTALLVRLGPSWQVAPGSGDEARSNWAKAQLHNRLQASAFDVASTSHAVSTPILIAKIQHHIRTQHGANGHFDVLTVFEQFDEDGNGIISHAEFKKGLIKLHKFPLNDMEVEALVDICDANGDGKIHYNELRDFFQASSTSQNNFPSTARVLDVLAMCLQIAPGDRPSAASLLSHPFFCMGSEEQEVASSYAEEYITCELPPDVVRQQFAVPLAALEKELSNKNQFNAVDFCELVHRFQRYAVGKRQQKKADDADSGTANQDAKVVDELFRQQILDKIISVCLQYYRWNQDQAVEKRDEPGSETSMGLRVIHRVCKLLKRLLFEFRSSSTALYVEHIAMSIVRFYLGEADLLPVTAGSKAEHKHESCWGPDLHEMCQVATRVLDTFIYNIYIYNCCVLCLLVLC
jgi:Ca2+-binding EF-hand superfamily protein